VSKACRKEPAVLTRPSADRAQGRAQVLRGAALALAVVGFALAGFHALGDEPSAALRPLALGVVMLVVSRVTGRS
jgi:hypothetical protein